MFHTTSTYYFAPSMNTDIEVSTQTYITSASSAAAEKCSVAVHLKYCHTLKEPGW